LNGAWSLPGRGAGLGALLGFAKAQFGDESADVPGDAPVAAGDDLGVEFHGVVAALVGTDPQVVRVLGSARPPTAAPHRRRTMVAPERRTCAACILLRQRESAP
jgi:hypothetical protein